MHHAHRYHHQRGRQQPQRDRVPGMQMTGTLAEHDVQAPAGRSAHRVQHAGRVQRGATADRQEQQQPHRRAAYPEEIDRAS